MLKYMVITFSLGILPCILACALALWHFTQYGLKIIILIICTGIGPMHIPFTS